LGRRVGDEGWERGWNGVLVRRAGEKGWEGGLGRKVGEEG